MIIEELRIGNWISAYHGDVQITSIVAGKPLILAIHTTPNKIGVSSGAIYTPIPLTEQWLKDFGFRTHEGNQYQRYWLFRDFEITERYNFFEFDYTARMHVMTKHTTPNVVIKYVHKLQNLYFDLKDEELIISPSDKDSGKLDGQ